MSQTITTATFYGSTDQGMVRSNNEDSFIACQIWDDRHILLAAIDGIGGYEGGEVAAEIARETIISVVREGQGNDCFTTLKNAVVKANNLIVEHKRNDPQRSSMGCVVSSAIIDLDRQQLFMVHVGDSRLYQFIPSEGLKKLSHDHSLIGFREEQGYLTEEQAMVHPHRNIIDRSLGDEMHTVDDPDFLDTAIIPFFTSTQFLFCSDGLSDMLFSAEIADVLKNDGPVETEVDTLISLANEAGGKDNITVVIAKVTVPQSAPADDSQIDFDSFDEPHTLKAPITPRVAESTELTEINERKSAGKSLRITLNALIVSIAAAFIIGGAAGFFAGNFAAKQQAIKELKKEPQPSDSVVGVENNPCDSIADSLKVGKQEADSINREYGKMKGDTSATREP